MPSNPDGYMQLYYIRNKERILSNILEKLTCDVCNKEMNKCNLKRHQKSQKCMLQRKNNELGKLIDTDDK